MKKIAWLSVLCSVAVVSGACQKAASPAAESGAATGSGAATAAARVGAGDEKFPEPRWPSYFKKPNSVDDLMQAARALVRNQSGLQGKGLGILAPGESVLIVASNDSDPMVLEAVKRALVERKVTPYIKYTYEMIGQTKEQATAQRQARTKGQNVEHAGIYQASAWITGQFPDPSQPKAWLKQKNPQLYAELFPGETGNEQPTAATGQRQRPRGEGAEDADTGAQPAGTGDYRGRNAVGESIKKFLTDHKEVRGVFWGAGGSTGLRRQLYPMQDKFLGTFITDNVYNLQSQMSTYPGDVWQLAEEQLLEPLVYVDRVEITDPEGTNLHADI